MLHIQPIRRTNKVANCKMPITIASQLIPLSLQKADPIVPHPGKTMLTMKKMRPQSPGHFWTDLSQKFESAIYLLN